MIIGVRAIMSNIINNEIISKKIGLDRYFITSKC